MATGICSWRLVFPFVVTERIIIDLAVFLWRSHRFDRQVMLQMCLNDNQSAPDAIAIAVFRTANMTAMASVVMASLYGSCKSSYNWLNPYIWIDYTIQP